MHGCHRTLAACLIATCLGAAAPVRGDETEVRNFLSAYAEAFNAEDVDKLAKMWAEEAVHVDRSTGETTEGRAEILQDIRDVFAQAADTRISGEVDSLRFPSAEVAVLGGTITTMVTAEQPTRNRFSAVLVRGEAGWQFDSVEEAPLAVRESAAGALTALEWLLGDWVDQSEGRQIITSVNRSEGGSFLIRTTAEQATDGSLTRAGTEVIGWDPRAQQIRSWTFNADGSFGDGTWSPSGDDWLVKVTQTLADGSAASGTYVLTPLDQDTLRVRLIGHEVEGAPLPASEAVRMVRVGDDGAPVPQERENAAANANQSPSN